GLFHGGQYVPLHADSGREDNIVAFALRRNGSAVIAVAPRLFARLMREDDPAPIGERVWGAAGIASPNGLAGKFQNVLTGEEFDLQQGLPLARLLARFPVALLVNS
ncbi:MAG TPA: hypothetical protein VKE95_07115, partial [Burkholderiales bacterium]|nr:hypothetical protein [Burkholderiales bacterium]